MSIISSPTGRHLGVLLWAKLGRVQKMLVLSPVSLASRDQDGGPSDSTIDIYDPTEKQGDCEQSIVCA